MNQIDQARRKWNEDQKRLRDMLENPQDFPAAIELFLRQHAILHASRLETGLDWTFDDALWQDLSPDQARRLLPKEEHSIAWLLWHMARCEDIAMNVVVDGGDQVMFGDNQWSDKLMVSAVDTGNAMDAKQIAQLSENIDLLALREYRTAVGKRTQEIVLRLEPGDLKRKADPYRLERIRQEGAVVETAWGIAEYWGRSTVAGLLLMPATRHNMVHLNEAFQIKRKLMR